MTFAGSAAWLLHALTHSLACSHSLTSTHIQAGITRPQQQQQQHAWLPRCARGQHNKAPPTPRAPVRVSHPVPLSLFLFSPPYFEPSPIGLFRYKKRDFVADRPVHPGPSLCDNGKCARVESR